METETGIVTGTGTGKEEGTGTQTGVPGMARPHMAAMSTQEVNTSESGLREGESGDESEIGRGIGGGTAGGLIDFCS
jgi:hypothetical protein